MGEGGGAAGVVAGVGEAVGELVRAWNIWVKPPGFAEAAGAAGVELAGRAVDHSCVWETGDGVACASGKAGFAGGVSLSKQGPQQVFFLRRLG